MFEEQSLFQQLFGNGWRDWHWLVLGGMIVLALLVWIPLILFSKNVFQRQLGVLVKATDERSRTLYLEHLPFLNDNLTREVKRLEQMFERGWKNHDRDVVLLLREIERLEGLVTGKTPVEKVGVTEEEGAQASRVMLSRIRRGDS